MPMTQGIIFFSFLPQEGFLSPDKFSSWLSYCYFYCQNIFMKPFYYSTPIYIKKISNID